MILPAARPATGRPTRRQGEHVGENVGENGERVTPFSADWRAVARRKSEGLAFGAGLGFGAGLAFEPERDEPETPSCARI